MIQITHIQHIINRLILKLYITKHPDSSVTAGTNPFKSTPVKWVIHDFWKLPGNEFLQLFACLGKKKGRSSGISKILLGHLMLQAQLLGIICLWLHKSVFFGIWYKKWAVFFLNVPHLYIELMWRIQITGMLIEWQAPDRFTPDVAVESSEDLGPFRKHEVAKSSVIYHDLPLSPFLQVSHCHHFMTRGCFQEATPNTSIPC